MQLSWEPSTAPRTDSASRLRRRLASAAVAAVGTVPFFMLASVGDGPPAVERTTVQTPAQPTPQASSPATPGFPTVPIPAQPTPTPAQPTATPTAQPTKPPKPPKPPKPADPKLGYFKDVKKGKWTSPTAGVRQMSFTARGHVGHIVEIDIRRPDLALRTTNPNGERGLTVSQFADRTDALLAFNGAAWEVNGQPWDWNDFHPRGLTVSQGKHWAKTADQANDMFIACDAQDRCDMSTVRKATKKIDPDWRQVISGWGDPMVVDGKIPKKFQDGHAYQRHPRTAMGITAEGKLVVVLFEGRRSDAQGATYLDTARVLQEMRVVDGIQLDGGGSTTLVVKGKRVNDLPAGQGSERGVAHSIAVVKTKG